MHEVDAIYSLYPRKIGKRSAIKSISFALTRLRDGESGKPMEWRAAECFLAARTSEFANSPAGKKGEFTPHPTTWFNQSRYLDDVKEWSCVERPNAAQEKQSRTRDNLTAAIRNRYSSDAGQGGSEDEPRSNAGGERRLDRTLGAGTQPRH